MKDDEQEKFIELEAEYLWAKLKAFFGPKQRIFVLAEINTRITRRLRNRESTRYHVDFGPEPDTKPGIHPEVGDRETRPIDIDSLVKLVRGTKKPGENE